MPRGRNIEPAIYGHRENCLCDRCLKHRADLIRHEKILDQSCREAAAGELEAYRERRAKALAARRQPLILRGMTEVRGITGLAADPAAEILLALSGPLGLDAGELMRAVPDQPPGTCRDCRQPAPGGSCWYCAEAYRLRTRAMPPAPVPAAAGPARGADMSVAACLLVLASAGLAAASFWYFWLLIPSFCLMIAGLRWDRL